MKLGYTIIFVDDVAEAVDFYERAFGIEREFVHKAGDYAQMSTGETKLAFTSHALGATAVPVAYTAFDPGQTPAGVELTLITDDVAAGFAKAVSAGAVPLAEPHDTEWGQTVSYVRDHVGTLVSIASGMDG
ncbi:putative glyoxalase superfamily protein PhnB [Arthrobacter sp. CAN_A212]|uniref:VOC family protein n=1 Tax=Arthrobacter sp. CAN_A212 TaxID=2787719 RepID=UPI0018C987B6